MHVNGSEDNGPHISDVLGLLGGRHQQEGGRKKEEPRTLQASSGTLSL